MNDMEYYRSNIAGGIPSTNSTDASTAVLNSASDAYGPNYWNIPYTDGLSPMKQIEGKIHMTSVWKILFQIAGGTESRVFLSFEKNVKMNEKIDSNRREWQTKSKEINSWAKFLYPRKYFSFH